MSEQLARGNRAWNFIRTSWHGNVFCISGPLYGEWAGAQRSSNEELSCFQPEQTVKQTVESWVIWDTLIVALHHCHVNTIQGWHRFLLLIYVTYARRSNEISQPFVYKMIARWWWHIRSNHEISYKPTICVSKTLFSKNGSKPRINAPAQWSIALLTSFTHRVSMPFCIAKQSKTDHNKYQDLNSNWYGVSNEVQRVQNKKKSLKNQAYISVIHDTAPPS